MIVFGNRRTRRLDATEWAILVISSVVSGVVAGLYLTQVTGSFGRNVFAGALGWALAIAALDYSFLSTPKEKFNFRQTVAFVPRLLLALAAGALVASALVTTIYRREVDSQLHKSQAAVIVRAEQDIRAAHAAGLKAAIDKVAETKMILDAATAAKNAAQERYAAEFYGRPGSSGKPGDGPVFKQEKVALDAATTALNHAQRAYDDAVTARDAGQTADEGLIKSEVAVRAKEIKADTGPLAREAALRQVIEANPSLEWQVRYLAAAALLVDLFPALFALLRRRDAQDRRLIAEDEAEAELAERAAQAAGSEVVVAAAIQQYAAAMAANLAERTQQGRTDRSLGARGRPRGVWTRRFFPRARAAAAIAVVLVAGTAFFLGGSGSPDLPAAAMALAATPVRASESAPVGCKQLASSPAVARLVSAAEVLDSDPAPAAVFAQVGRDLRAAADDLGPSGGQAILAASALEALARDTTDPTLRSAAAGALATFDAAVGASCAS